MALKEIKIGDLTVSDNSPILMIAEIGLNHNGDLQIAKKLIDGAFACNWHCVKFQKRTPDICVPDHQKNVMRETPWGKITYLEYRKQVEFGQKEYDYIDRYCREKPIYWTASVWDKPSLDFLLGYNIPCIKIPSAKLTESDLLIESAKTGKPVILSTGMSELEEIDKAVECLETYGAGNYILMHTNSTYPTPPDELNLSVISTLRERYHCIIGYSGHEYDLEPSVIAVSLGAKIIERHITLDHKMWGSDHFASLEVHAVDLLHKRIKDVHLVLGENRKHVTKGELEIRKKLRGV
ncbi:N-acetylneuraminate synthase family protein [Thermodesulfobacteriota bacterium]